MEGLRASDSFAYLSNNHVPAPNYHVFVNKLFIMHLSALIPLVDPSPSDWPTYYIIKTNNTSVIGTNSSINAYQDYGLSHSIV